MEDIPLYADIKNLENNIIFLKENYVTNSFPVLINGTSLTPPIMDTFLEDFKTLSAGLEVNPDFKVDEKFNKLKEEFDIYLEAISNVNLKDNPSVERILKLSNELATNIVNLKNYATTLHNHIENIKSYFENEKNNYDETKNNLVSALDKIKILTQKVNELNKENNITIQALKAAIYQKEYDLYNNEYNNILATISNKQENYQEVQSKNKDKESKGKDKDPVVREEAKEPKAKKVEPLKTVSFNDKKEMIQPRKVSPRIPSKKLSDFTNASNKASANKLFETHKYDGATKSREQKQDEDNPTHSPSGKFY